MAGKCLQPRNLKNKKIRDAAITFDSIVGND